MHIRFGFRMGFRVEQPTPLVLLLHTHPRERYRVVVAEDLSFSPNVPGDAFLDSFGSHAVRVVAPAGSLTISLDSLAQDSGKPDPWVPEAREAPFRDLPSDVLQYLLPSRYCEVDRLAATAWSLFGHTPRGWARVQAVSDWVHRHLTFDYQLARPTRSAFEGYQEGVGVCRDFTHLAITFCRALNIPARYVTGYLGDIGIPPVPYPMDFSAWFEVYLDGGWHTFDARHNTPRIGRIVMAYGRDAADVAMVTSFGAHELGEFAVWTDEVVEQDRSNLQ